MSIRYHFAAPKAAAAIQRLVERHPGIDLHAALKSFYFAEKSHLNTYGRPIFGARYRAMSYGPVPLEIYEMMKGEGYWLAELQRERWPWAMNGYRLYPSGENIRIDDDVLAQSDIEHFDSAVERSRTMTFTARTAATHGADWHAADMGTMRYEDMLEDGPGREALLGHMIENGGNVRL